MTVTAAETQETETGTTTGPLPVGAIEAPRATWPWALVTLAGLAYMVWAGSSYDPRKTSLWFFKRDGWISLAPGLGHLLIAWVIVFAGLSMVAWRAQTELKLSGMWRAVIIGFIGVMALDLRLAVMRSWMPLVLDPGVLGARAYHAATAGRGLAILADMVTLGILFAGLEARGRNCWLAALFAFHPLAIIESAANGSHVSWLLPVLALAALGWRLQRWLREFVIMGAAAGCTWWLAHLALREAGARPFDGLLAQILSSLGLEGRYGAVGLIGVEMVLQALLVVLAFRQGWNLARTLGHMLVAWAIVSPSVMPAAVVPVLVLLVLGWTRAGWVLSGTVLGVYLMMGLYERAGGLAGWMMPMWLVFLIMVPVVVVEAQELVLGGPSPEKIA